MVISFWIQCLKTEFEHNHFIHLQLQSQFYIKQEDMLQHMKNPELTVLFACEFSWAQGNGQKPEAVPAFHQLH